MQRLRSDVQYLKGIGPRRRVILAKLGIVKIFDVFWHIPRSYFDSNKVVPIAKLPLNESGNIIGEIVDVESSRSRRGISIIKALINDASGSVKATWFNQPFMANVLQPGRQILLRGKISENSIGEMAVTEYLVLDSPDTERILPIYSLTEGVSQKVMRSMTKNALAVYLDDYPEIIPENIREQWELIPIRQALEHIHFPPDRVSYQAARRRLAVEELLLFQMNLQRNINAEDLSFVQMEDRIGLVGQVKGQLPFALTTAQERVAKEIFNDMASPRHMNRLLQGDVGSGKTVVAALCLAQAISAGYQAALMAPTEILADQHYQSLRRFFQNTGVNLALFTGGASAPERREIMETVEKGQIHIIVGTHSLIQERMEFNRLGLVVIDEQHRFGVRQRGKLAEKGASPDVLVMTATPIPRTLALTFYGDLNVSVLDEMPPGRQPVKTKFVPLQEREQAYKFVLGQLRSKRQVYIVCPLIEESENLDLQAALSLYQELKTNVYREYQVGLLHGKMKPAEKEQVMQAFKNEEIQVLVTTTVIEVGVDVPNASVMVVEQAERFGLSQLHQLRGRVGRGYNQSYCLLIADPRTDEAVKRLRALERSNDGFQLAQEDLAIRGPGDFWGIRQHGLHQLQVADLAKDYDLIQLSCCIKQEMPAIDYKVLKNYIDLKFDIDKLIVRN